MPSSFFKPSAELQEDNTRKQGFKLLLHVLASPHQYDEVSDGLTYAGLSVTNYTAAAE
jgi:hypothetical protein